MTYKYSTVDNPFFSFEWDGNIPNSEVLMEETGRFSGLLVEGYLGRPRERDKTLRVETIYLALQDGVIILTPKSILITLRVQLEQMGGEQVKFVFDFFEAVFLCNFDFERNRVHVECVANLSMADQQKWIKSLFAITAWDHWRLSMSVTPICNHPQNILSVSGDLLPLSPHTGGIVDHVSPYNFFKSQRSLTILHDSQHIATREA